MVKPRVALVSRELHPFIGGGIAPIVRAAAELLCEVADVTLFTTSMHRRRYAELTADGPLYPESIRVLFVEEPPSPPPHYYSHVLAYSDAVFQALLEAYPDGGPDFVEFPDYLAEGYVTIQAKRTGEPRLQQTMLAVRTHTTLEFTSVLNGHLDDKLEHAVNRELERYCLRNADRLLWPGGDILAAYQRYYGADALAPAVEIPDAFLGHGLPGTPPQPAGDGPLRLLYLGRMERRKGVLNLIRALLTTDSPDWTLDLVGGDTPTAPLGLPMRDQLVFMTAGEERIRFHDAVPHAEVGRMIERADALVVPSLWECWPNVAREALAHERPVLGTPVGGLVAFIRPGESGFLARDTSVGALRDLLNPFVDDPEPLRALSRSGGPGRVLAELTDPELIRSRYAGLFDAAMAVPAPAPRRRRPPLVSIVVPYFAMDRFVEDTLRSIAGQSYPRVETIVVNDGSRREEDRVLEALSGRYDFRLVTQRNRYLGAARNYGIAHARGRFVLPLDSDDMISPDFVERCVGALEHDGDLAWIGTWMRYIDEDGRPLSGDAPGYTPLGSWSQLTDRQNVACGPAVLLRRHLFDEGFAYSIDLTSFEDWMLYRLLRQAGHLGSVIPRPLLTYRVRDASMLRAMGNPHWERFRGEVAAHLAEGGMQWTARSA